MKEFVLKEIVARDMESELAKIGFDSAYRFKASDKYKYKTLKIFDLTPAQANILKQTALICGSDCAVHREVITGKIETSNAILGGSISELKKIAERLKKQPFSLGILGDKIFEQLSEIKQVTKLVGILNVTPNSFSDGGKYYNPEQACEHLYQLVEDGADMIDIGAESTKPFAEAVSAEIQIERLAPVLKEIKNIDIPVSIDTRSSEVARFALEYGAKIINDVSGMDFDPLIADVVSEYGAGIVIQHSSGNTQDKPEYKDVVEEVYLSLLKKAEFAKSKGIKNIILDVGIGFGKKREDNFEILNRIEEFHSLKLPLMVGVSRKSLLGEYDNETKDALTLALSYPLIQKGVDYLRVHNVKLHKQLLNSVD